MIREAVRDHDPLARCQRSCEKPARADLASEVHVAHHRLRRDVLGQAGEPLPDELARRILVRLGASIGLGLRADLVLQALGLMRVFRHDCSTGDRVC